MRGSSTLRRVMDLDSDQGADSDGAFSMPCTLYSLVVHGCNILIVDKN